MKPADSSRQSTGTTLEELERFRQDIERYRARRKAVSEEFEGFVRGFKETPATSPQAEPPARPAAPAIPAPRPVGAPPPPAPAELPREASLPTVPRIEPAPSIDLDHRGASTRRSWIPLAIGALVALVVLAVWWFGRTPADVPAPAPATAAAPAAVPQPAAPATAPPAPPADPFESVLTTTRPVWLRVIADGNRVINRELPGGARVPFKAEKNIEIRAGDAGAVRLSIGGRDQGPLGRDGTVVTRSFTVER